jgi:hypothetical protein
LDPSLRLHNDPDKKLSSLLLGRGADPKLKNTAGLCPDQGLAVIPSMILEERALLAQEGLAMPPSGISSTYARHHRVLSDARAQLERGTPHPNLKAYEIKPAVVPPWELPEANPMNDKSMMERKSSLAAARRAAKDALERSAQATNW